MKPLFAWLVWSPLALLSITSPVRANSLDGVPPSTRCMPSRQSVVDGAKCEQCYPVHEGPRNDYCAELEHRGWYERCHEFNNRWDPTTNRYAGEWAVWCSRPPPWHGPVPHGIQRVDSAATQHARDALQERATIACIAIALVILALIGIWWARSRQTKKP
jgi:hypothetical protein